MKRKRTKKKKNRTLTASLVLLISITALITQIETGLFSWIYRYLKDSFWPAKLELSLTKCFIYRTEFEDFPTCELDIIINNPSTKTITAKLKELRLFRDNILYRFTAHEGIIKAEPEDQFVQQVKFGDKVLDIALKVPQDSAAAVVELLFEYVATNRSDTLKLDDDDVIKCTYWQTPIFNSETEALSVGASVVGIRGPVHFLDTLTGKQGEFRLDIKAFRDRQGVVDFDFSAFVRRLFAKDISWDYYEPAFRRKYGGVYLGVLASDAREADLLASPHDLFGGLGRYDEYRLLGTTLQEDLSKTVEFIHYIFDPAKRNQVFELSQENSRFFLLLAYEDKDGIGVIIDSLTSYGYRAAGISTKRFGALEHVLCQITADEKIVGLAQTFNNNVDSLNFVISRNGFFVFVPVALDWERTHNIATDVARITNKPHFFALSFDCRPFKSPLPPAPFATPVLVFLNFSAETEGVRVKSIEVEYR
jgi:hypothetical protein